MSTLTRWNPFKSLAGFDPATSFEDMFRGLRPAWRDFDISPEVRIDVSEDDKSYTVKAEIPGVDKKDIEISIEGNEVAISAETKRETKKKEGEKEIYTDRYYGKVYRSFSLPNDLDSAKAEARYENGVLMLMLPKVSGNGSSRKIAVN